MSAIKTVWGFEVPTSPSGRFKWPKELRAVAVRKILDEGFLCSAIAKEIGANENLVRRWSTKEKSIRQFGKEPETNFAPVTMAEAPTETKAVETSEVAEAQPRAMCKLTYADLVLEFPGDIPMKSLQAIVRAIRGAQ